MAQVIALGILLSYFNMPSAQEIKRSCEVMAREDCRAMHLSIDRCRLYKQQFVSDCRGTRIE
jgi:hypothetical protein